MKTLIGIISMEFLSLSRRHSSTRNIPAAKSEEKQMFSQAIIKAVQDFPLQGYGYWNFLEPSANGTLLSTGPCIKPY